MGSERLSNLFCNGNEFIKAPGKYQNVLNYSGFKDELIYTPCNQPNSNRKTIWYNPPFVLQLKTNIGKTFFQLLGRIFYPIIDYIAAKISYSCMPNMASHISSHNKNIIQEFKKWQYPNRKTWLSSSRGLSL